jgi:hypothetical protein
MDKINIFPIVSRHIDTLVDHSTGRRSLSDIFLFFGFPLLVSSAGFYYKWGLSVDAMNAVLASFAIFAGLLLNLLILVYTFSSETNHPNALAKVRVSVIRQLHDNIAYSVLISMTVVVLALIAVARIKISDSVIGVPRTGPYMTSALVYLTINFVLTLLMILKRIHGMLRSKLDQPAVRKAS